MFRYIICKDINCFAYVFFFFLTLEKHIGILLDLKFRFKKRYCIKGICKLYAAFFKSIINIRSTSGRNTLISFLTLSARTTF